MKLLFLLAYLISSANSYPYGAPETACGNFYPIHDTSSPQTSDSPYTISVSDTEYAVGATLTVTLQGSGSDSILGFLIAAVVEGDNDFVPIGSFTASGATDATDVQIRCNRASGAALTHTSTFSGAGGSERVELTWTAPAAVAGYIRFRVTFVKKKDTFWFNVPSMPISDGQSSPPTSAAPVTPSGPVTENPSFQAITTDSCGSDKSCLTPCSVRPCADDFIVSWKRSPTNNNDMSFEFLATGVNSNTYAAIGIAPTTSMVDVTVVACTINGQGTGIFYNHAVSIAGVSSISGVSTDASDSSSYNGNDRVLSCRFTYSANSAASNDKLKNLIDTNSQFYMFIARGPLIQGTTSILKHTKIPLASPQAINFASSSADSFIWLSDTTTLTFPLAKAHGCVMIVAWALCASIGVLLARYFKPMWPDSKGCDKKPVWFTAHRALMLTCMSLTAIGTVLIVVDKDGEYSSNLTKSPDVAHPILGIIAIACSILNPIFAAFRCHPGEKYRPVFNWVHWFFGTIGYIAASVTIVIGLQLSRILPPTYPLYAVGIAFVVWHSLIELILLVQQLIGKWKKSDEQANINTGNTQQFSVETKEDNSKSAEARFKHILFIVYIVVATGLSLAMVIGVAVSNGAN